MGDHHGMLTAVADGLDTIRTAEIETLDHEDAVRLLVALTTVRKQMQALEDAVTLRVARLAPKDPVTIPGVGVVTVRAGGARRAWHTHDLTRDIIAARLEKAGGEIPDPFTAAAWVMECANIGYFRTTALKDLGLDPDDYSERVTGRPSVQIT